MDSVTSVNLHHFGNGLLLEVVGNDPDGEVFVQSVELDLVDAEEERVRPRTPLPSAGGGLIEERVEEAGYTLVPEPLSAATNGHEDPPELTTR